MSRNAQQKCMDWGFKVIDSDVDSAAHAYAALEPYIHTKGVLDNDALKHVLYDCCCFGPFYAVQFLVEQELSDLYHHYDVAFSIAAHHGHHDIVRLLIEHGADVNVKSEYGEDILTGCAKQGDLDMVKLLLSEGFNVQDNNNEAVLAAWQNGHDAIVKLLKKAGSVLPWE